MIEQLGTSVLISSDTDSLLLKKTNLLAWKQCAMNYVIPLTTKNDYVIGSNGSDLFKGLDGDDEVYGKKGNDTLYGNGDDDILKGGPGKDKLVGGQGDDKLYGGSGDDLLIGGPGRDILLGGLGRDIFKFNNIAESSPSRPDRIKDFQQNIDRINLKTIDAIKATSTNDSFIIDNSRNAGTLSLLPKDGYFIIEGHIDDDKSPDFKIRVDKTQVLKATDFLL